MRASQALNSSHPVVGRDSHCQGPSPLPPFGPHIVVAVMDQADPTTTKASATVKAGTGFALGRRHDLGRGKYHFAGNPLMPLIWAGAANKAEFGCASVTVGHCGADKASVTMAVALPGGLGLQLDCGEPCPWPSSLCIASLNTVHAGLTTADAVAGFGAMVVDLALTWALGKVAGVLTTALQQQAFNALGYVLSLLGPDVRLVAALDTAMARETGEVVKTVMGWFIGTPLGYSTKVAVLDDRQLNWNPFAVDGHVTP